MSAATVQGDFPMVTTSAAAQFYFSYYYFFDFKK